MRKLKILSLLFIIMFSAFAENDTLIVKELMKVYEIPDSLINKVAKFTDSGVVELKLKPGEMYLKNIEIDKKIPMLPESLGDLKGLEKLTIHNVTEYPGFLNKLKKLEKLKIKSPYLKEISENMAKMSSLKELNIDSPVLTNISGDLYKLSKLKKLRLTGSNKCMLPIGIENLAKLKTLYVREIKIPDQVFKKGSNLKLKKLFVENSKLPESVGNLVNLKSLVYREIPKHYKRTHLNANNVQTKLVTDSIVSTSPHKIQDIPKSIINLKNLKNINITSFHLAKVPDVIGKIKTLETISLSNFRLDGIPVFLNELDSLKVLKLRYCNLKEISQEILKLIKLKELDLSSNQISVIPEDLIKMVNLKNINLSNNKICKLKNEELEKWINTRSKKKKWKKNQKCF